MACMVWNSVELKEAAKYAWRASVSCALLQVYWRALTMKRPPVLLVVAVVGVTSSIVTCSGMVA
jgi:hypothetical protein